MASGKRVCVTIHCSGHRMYLSDGSPGSRALEEVSQCELHSETPPGPSRPPAPATASVAGGLAETRACCHGSRQLTSMQIQRKLRSVSTRGLGLRRVYGNQAMCSIVIPHACPATRYTTSIATKSAPYTRLITTSALALQSQHCNANLAPAGHSVLTRLIMK